MDLSYVPGLNASLNAASAVFLVMGYVFIRQRFVKAHIMAMLIACCTSLLFLVSYLYYHYHQGATPFQGQGIIRTVYFTILVSHTVLALVMAPLVVITLVCGLRGNFYKHVRVARWTFPIWLYVSVTGVVVYWMLYRL